ncbi:hypothetical protein BCV71DRAFT_240158 [Rhizopus microsporus]|uniref:Uncharacterized protein n=1 Tax=Rhizopus microsporus TaxID=58291 RepID=A0A1X0RKH7_RHIZD|nr:hypothetical protein BCV71DRAFT_240158 [Rhizopus microsporus]
MNRANTKASSQGEKEVGQKYSKALTVVTISFVLVLLDAQRRQRLDTVIDGKRNSQMILAGSVSMSDHFEGNVDAAWQQRRINFRSTFILSNGINYHHIPGGVHIMLLGCITCFTDKYTLAFSMSDTIQGISVDYRCEK